MRRGIAARRVAGLAHNVSDEDAALIASRTGWQRDKGVTRLRFDLQKAAKDQVKALAEAGLGA